MTTDIYTKKEALGHLFRRAGFGATPSEIEQAMKLEYNQVVDHLLDFNHNHFVLLPGTLIVHCPKTRLNLTKVSSSLWNVQKTAVKRN